MLLGEGRDRNDSIDSMKMQDLDVLEWGQGVVVEVITRKAYRRVKSLGLNSIAIYDCCCGVKR
jgi:hypothetical protein